MLFTLALAKFSSQSAAASLKLDWGLMDFMGKLKR